ncbi:hypothetical protein CCAND95_130077 [Capnocytophaga canis]|uniref:Uncharacterized protein n=1 Tax=Capnocytophaga canis TaxID=1848903 RepID=A0A0B7HTS0_9FLAO|nr:hypothetical protein CCAND95_130077 [Capnocytophaga canis]CEN46706.1 hypothetical protein CCAND38_370064 [Capnocytophaga canis]CEN50695.1 hypothetical protein CCAND93_120042 [Capnocytophaga canis]
MAHKATVGDFVIVYEKEFYRENLPKSRVSEMGEFTFHYL